MADPTRPPEHAPASRVLVIDDAPDIHDLVELRLGQSPDPIEVLHALDAESGIRLARKHRPEAILLDLDLPDRDGFDICRELAEDPRTGSTPIIFLTGTVDVATKIRAFEAGASDYVTKPFDSFELGARVRAALRLGRYHRHLERAARQRKTLLELATSGDVDWNTRLDTILTSDAATLEVERVSYWRMASNGQSIECEALVRLSQNGREPGPTLHATDFPGYFRALASSSPIVAHDATTHPDTCEFAETYLRPLGIGAMMDVPVFVRGDLAGVVCHEHVGGVRAWEPDEIQFAVSIGQMLSLAMESENRRRAEEVLRHTALHDALTGLPNRVLLFDLLRREIGRLHRDPNYGFAVLYFDLDAFKPVNDELGHEAGDKLLASVAKRVSECLRPADVAARVGGDEFVAIIAGCRNAAEAQSVVKRLEATIRAPHRIGDRDVTVGASFGVALADESVSDASTILRTADQAMFKTKRERQRSRAQSTPATPGASP